VYTMVLLIGVERFFGKEDKNENHINDALVPDSILAMHVIMHTLSIATLLYAIHVGLLEGKFIWFATVSTGISSGIEGINSAHEMIHRKQRAWQLAGIWNLLLVNYGHFYTEHIRNHHKNVGTVDDPATAKFGESVYAFIIRTIPKQYKSAMMIEAVRLRKENRFAFGTGNFIIRVSFIQILICLLIYFFFSKVILLSYLLQSVIAFFLLEYVNYIEHYGLIRESGKKVNPTHSWQSDLTISRFALVELSRHSDHHMVASKPYHTLVSHNDSPVLPTGYFGSFYYALIPPLWFKLVHPVLNEFQKNKPGE
ncbi:MAG: alkane 1-monooxygenase, partial [Chitinophagales bacterium]|nr:alkane 1-monooxygenase [Chitinophagales bacterium]